MRSPFRALAAAALAAIAFASSQGTLAQSTTSPLVTGSWTATAPLGFDEKATFSCRGTPTCTGQYYQTVRVESCTNYASFSGEISFSTLNLSSSGPISGSLTQKGPDWDSAIVRKPDGSCEYPSPPIIAGTYPYAGTWDLATTTAS